MSRVEAVIPGALDSRLRLLRWMEEGAWPVLARSGVRGIKILRRLSRLIAPAPSGETTVTTLLGFKMALAPHVDSGVERAIYYHGIYEAGTLHVIRSALKAGDTLIDVGANVGLMSLAASSVVGDRGRVYAFEPVSACHDALVHNLELNDIRNVSVLRKALGSRPESRPIYEQLRANRGSSSLLKPSTFSGEATVEVTTLDDFAAEAAVGPVAMLKVDVEGWEMEVLRGARRLLAGQEPPMLIVECSTFHKMHESNTKELFRFLTEEFGYAVFKLKLGKEVPSRLVRVTSTRALPCHDNLFCFQAAHLERLPRELFAG